MRNFFFILFGLLIIVQPAFSFDNVDITTGFLGGPLKEQDHYKNVPLLVSFNWKRDNFVENIVDRELLGDMYFCLEPFVNYVFSPDNNLEVGVNFLIKYVFPSEWVLRPYVKGGLGALFMTQHTREQSTQYNFLPQIGGGFSYTLSESMTLNIEYRFRHLSNSSFKSPNMGIDTHMYLVGTTISF